MNPMLRAVRLVRSWSKDYDKVTLGFIAKVHRMLEDDDIPLSGIIKFIVDGE